MRNHIVAMVSSKASGLLVSCSMMSVSTIVKEWTPTKQGKQQRE